jgi:hypothetical protein
MYYCPVNYLEGLRETTVNIPQDNRAPGSDLNPEAAENNTTQLTAIYNVYRRATVYTISY